MTTVRHFARTYAVVLSLIAPSVIWAQEAQFEVLNGWRADDGTHIAALQFDLAPGWQTYWRTPGDVGIPPSFDWSGSRNLENVKVNWPQPLVYESYGARTIGYKDLLVLPLQVTPKRPGGRITLAGRVEIGVCKDICIPASFTFRVSLDAVSEHDGTINNALSRVPQAITASQFGQIECGIEPISDGLRVTARILGESLGGDEVAVMEYADASIWVSQTQVDRKGNHLAVAADFVAPDGLPFPLERNGITLSLFGDHAAIEIGGCPAPS